MEPQMTAGRAPLRVLGMMSGTSFDGVDAALLETDGQAHISRLGGGFEPYTPDERAILRKALGAWPSEELDAAHEIVLSAHLRLASQFEADLIGFHGQTLAHDPAGGRTHQLGDGAELARRAGREVIWDFRSADMKAGGQGAPLAPFYHHALARAIGCTSPVVFLNLGGVGNVTWVDPRASEPDAPGALLAFDTGPANALMDDFIARRTGKAFDDGGKIAAQGVVIDDFLKDFLADPYFADPPPKSLDRDHFAALLDQIDADASDADGAATLLAMSVAAVAQSARFFPAPPERWLVCGGGRRNGVMMAALGAALSAEVAAVEAVGLNGDLLEAEAFAWLAMRVRLGLATSAPSTTGCASPVSGGRIAGLT